MKAGKIGLSLLCTRVRRILCAWAVLLLACAAPAGHAAVEYVYDDLGRLTGVIDDTGAAAHYSYDALGNILSIETTAAGGVSVLGFTPNSGAPGDTVTIRGTGFSATPNQNTVTFNGVAASVSTAAARSLVVTVPVGATTGKIGVTTPLGSATSAADFVVTAGGGGAPTITGFTPAAGVEGTVVTVTGTNFDTSLAGTSVSFNESFATGVIVSSPTTLTATVPANTSSGKIRVRTAAGTAVSANDFTIAPTGINPADVVATARITVDGASQTLDIGTANKYGALYFDGTGGGYFTLDVTSFTGNVTYLIYSPRKVQLASGTLTSRASIHIPPSPSSGTYAIYFRSNSATANLTASVARDKSIAADGATLNQAFAFNGQSKRFTFNATPGQNLGLGISGLTLTPSGSSASVTVYTPDGVVHTNNTCWAANGGCNLNVGSFVSAGTYSVVVVPASSGTGSFTATLSSDLTGTLTAGTPFSLSIPRIGQNARLGFSGTTGDSVALKVYGLTTTPASQSVSVQLLKPDGTVLNAFFVSGAGNWLNVASLPATGTYTLFVDPSNIATASMQIMVDPGTPIGIDGSPVNMSIATLGDVARLTFSGTAGQNLGLGISALTLSPSPINATVTVYKPDGISLTAVTTCAVSNGGCNFNLSSLPSTGTYSVMVVPGAIPGAGGTGSFTVTLSSDLTGTLTVGAPYSLSIPRIGQNARLSFSAATGNSVALKVYGLTTAPANQSVTVTVLKPDGTALNTLFASGAGSYINLASLPATGTYTLFVDPSNIATVSTQIMVDPGTPIAIDGAAVNMSIATAGDIGRLTFSGTAGQNLGLGISGLTVTPSGSLASVTVYKPDGNQLTATSCSASSGGCNFNLSSLPSTGTYSVIVVPPAGGTATFSATLSSDLTGTLTVGTPYSLSIPRIGQNARVSFSAATGNSVALKVYGLTTTPANQSVSVQVLKPDGTALNTLGVTGVGNWLNFASLPATGTYTLFVDPSNIATVSTQIMVDPGTPIAIDGSAVNMSIATAGDIARLTFSGTAGQNLGLGISSLALTPSGSISVIVYKPDGNALTSGSCFAGNGGCNFNLSGLLSTGTYSVIVVPPTGSTASFSATLSSDLTGTLTVGAPYSLSIPRIGQNARLSFSAATGNSVALKVYGLTTTPANQSVSVQVLKPDGTVLNTLFASGAGSYNNLASLPATGTYTLFVDPTNTATVSTQIMVDPGTPIAIDGSSVNMSIATAGDIARLTFSGTAGQNLGLGISSLTLTPSGSSAGVTVYKPDGNQLTSASCSMGNGGCNLNLSSLPSTGTYSVIVVPPTGGTASFSATLSSDLTDTLTVGTPYSLSIPRIGQNARVSFSAATGNSVALKVYGLTTTPANQSVTVQVLKPDGTVLNTLFASGAGSYINFASLPATGTYTLFVDPSNTATVSTQIMVDPGTPIAIDGSAVNLSIATAGDIARLTFSGTAGQNLGLGISSLTLTPSGSSAGVTVYKPDGNQLTGASCSMGNGGCNLNLSSLPSTGTYSVVVVPASSGTGSFTATLSSDLTGTLTAGTPFSLSIPRIGQNARLTFSGTSGQTKSISVTSIVTSPTGKTVFFSAFKPDGTALTSASTSASSTTINLPSYPVTGTYTLFVDPADTATANMTITLSP